MADDWVGGVPQVAEYWTGSVKDSPVVNIKNEQVEMNRQPIWNILAEIKGVDHLEEKVIIGAHRDAWCFGAGDPNSSTAIMLEMARVFGKMMEFGWRPQRTIVFASWDAKEYNLIGSTEFVEHAGESLRDDVIAYINLDAAVTGHDFRAAGSPALGYALSRALSRVHAPNSHALLNATWDPLHMPGLGGGGDWVAFQHHAGVSSIDLSFTGHIVPAHSCNDNFAYLKSRVDPGFTTHEALGRVVILLLLELADHSIIPLDMAAYAHALERYTDELAGWVAGKGGKGKVDIGPLRRAMTVVQRNIGKFSQMNEGWMAKDKEGMYVQTDEWAVSERRSRSIRMGNFDKHLVDMSFGGGTPGRRWFRHLVMGPQVWIFFPPFS